MYKVFRGWPQPYALLSASSDPTLTVLVTFGACNRAREIRIGEYNRPIFRVEWRVRKAWGQLTVRCDRVIYDLIKRLGEMYQNLRQPQLVTSTDVWRCERPSATMRRILVENGVQAFAWPALPERLARHALLEEAGVTDGTDRIIGMAIERQDLAAALAWRRQFPQHASMRLTAALSEVRSLALREASP